MRCFLRKQHMMKRQIKTKEKVTKELFLPNDPLFILLFYYFLNYKIDIRFQAKLGWPKRVEQQSKAPTLIFHQVADGIFQCEGNGPISYMISLWQDHTSLMASGVPIPAPLGSPAGPNLYIYQNIFLATIIKYIYTIIC